MATKKVVKPSNKTFQITLPEGAVSVNLRKDVIKELLQKSCNLTIQDFEIEETEGLQSFVIKFV